MGSDPTSNDPVGDYPGACVVPSSFSATTKVRTRAKRAKTEHLLELTPIDVLLNEPDTEPEWLVEGMIPTGSLVGLIGKPKAGKSTIARYLATCIAQGHDFLGRRVKQGRVVYLALEEKRSQIRMHFRALLQDAGAPIAVFVGTSLSDACSRLRLALTREPATLVVIDPLFRFIQPKDGNDYAQMTKALDPLLAIARDTNACLLATHHAPKMDKTDIDSPIGSTAIAGSVDTLIVLKREKRRRLLSTVQRTGEDLEETVISHDPETNRLNLGGTRKASDIGLAKLGIKAFLASVPEPVERTAIEQNVQVRTEIVRGALNELVIEGAAARSGGGRRNDPYLYSLPRFPVPLHTYGTRNPEAADTGATND